MREELVRHAAPQKSCPTVEMTSTSLNHPVSSACWRIDTATYAPPAASLLTASTLVAAKVMASSRTQPKTAE